MSDDPIKTIPTTPHLGHSSRSLAFSKFQEPTLKAWLSIVEIVVKGFVLTMANWAIKLCLLTEISIHCWRIVLSN